MFLSSSNKKGSTNNQDKKSMTRIISSESIQQHADSILGNKQNDENLTQLINKLIAQDNNEKAEAMLKLIEKILNNSLPEKERNNACLELKQLLKQNEDVDNRNLLIGGLYWTVALLVGLPGALLMPLAPVSLVAGLCYGFALGAAGALWTGLLVQLGAFMSPLVLLFIGAAFIYMSNQIVKKANEHMGISAELTPDDPENDPCNSNQKIASREAPDDINELLDKVIETYLPKIENASICAM